MAVGDPGSPLGVAGGECPSGSTQCGSRPRAVNRFRTVSTLTDPLTSGLAGAGAARLITPRIGPCPEATDKRQHRRKRPFFSACVLAMRPRDHGRRNRDNDRDRDFERRDRDCGRDCRGHDRLHGSERDQEETQAKQISCERLGREERCARHAHAHAHAHAHVHVGERVRKRRGMWDVDYNGNNVLNPTSGNANASMAVSNPMVAQQQQAMAQALLQQQAAMTRRSRRLHVSNLPPELTRAALTELFNTVMTASGLACDAQPCVNDVQIAADNKFAFVEFRSVAETTHALCLDGMQLLSRPMRVSRPNDYAAPPRELHNVIIPQAISLTVTSNNPVNVIGGIMPNSMTPGMLMGGMTGLPGCGAAPSQFTSHPSAIQPAPSITDAGAHLPSGGPTIGASALLAHQVPSIGGAALLSVSDTKIDARTAGPGAVLPAGASSVSHGPTYLLPALTSSVGGGQSLPTSLLAASRRARRLHVGNLPTGIGLTAEMLKHFLNAALVSACLHDANLTEPSSDQPVIDVTLNGEGKFGFAEFRSIAECTSCLALNNIELNGKSLRIERPRDYTPMPDAMLEQLRAAKILGSTTIAPGGQDMLAHTRNMTGLAHVVDSIDRNASPPPAPGLPLPPLDTSHATTVLTLANMCTEAEYTDAEEMRDILEDAKGEAEKHGRVLAAAAPKPGGILRGDSKLCMKVLLRFADPDAAMACAIELHGKQFDGRTVLAAFVPEATFVELLEAGCHCVD